MSTHDLKTHRYLILAEGHFGPQTSKTANSAIRYLPERVLGVLDSTRAGQTAASVLGFGGDIPVLASLEQGLALGPSALLIGIAPSGGRLPEEWRPVLRHAIAAGLDIVSGLHIELADDPEISSLAEEYGVRLRDLRRPPADLPVATGKAQAVDALTVLTVGTDSNIGKMTAGLQIRDELARGGTKVGFAPTGQTGILIEGWGIAVDAVKADFIAGAAERLVLQAAEGNDVVLVEGQGALVHPGYSGVTLGLLHGSMPDVMILCHQPSRRVVYSAARAYDWVPLPDLPTAIRMYEEAIAPLRQSRVIGVSLHTGDLSAADARDAVRRAQEETGLPATDPVRFGAGPLAEAIVTAARTKNAIE